MRPKPSMIECFIANLPKDLQREALEAAVKEIKRIESGNLTKEERKMQTTAQRMGAAAGRSMEEVAARVFREAR